MPSVLSKFAKKPVDLVINDELTIQAKKLTLNDLVEVDAYLESFNAKEDDSFGVRVKKYVYCLYICIKKLNPDITLDEVNDLFDINDIKRLMEYGAQLGFIAPQTPTKKPATKAAKK